MTDERLNRAATDSTHASVPFTKELGIEVVDLDPGRTECRAHWAAERCTAGGSLHGGYLMAVADTAGALCAFLNLTPGTISTTSESKTNFFRPVTEGTISIVATPLHVGKRTIVVATDITREDGKAVSHTIQTQTDIDPTS